MKPSKHTTETRIAGVLCAIFAAVIIGCGGSGGGDAGTGSSATGTTATGTTATGTTATGTTATGTTATGTTATGTTATGTTATGTTATGTTSGLPGFLPPNKILYSENSGSAPQLKAVSPDGTGVQVIGTFPINVIAAVQDPNVSNQFFFAAGDVSGSGGPYQIFKGNSTLTTAGATLVSTQQFDYVSDLDVSPDGTTLVFTAAPTASDPLKLFKMPTAGGAPVYLDDATYFSLAPNGTLIAYVKDDLGTTNRIYTRGYATGSTPTAITGSLDISTPTWNHSSSKVLFPRSINGDPRDLYTVGASGGTITTLTNTPNLSELASTYNSDDTKIAYLAAANSAFPGASGIYVAASTGLSAVQIVASDSLNFESIYWTNAQGRLSSGGFKFSFAKHKRSKATR